MGNYNQKGVLCSGKTFNKIKVTADSLEIIIRVICDSNNLDFPYTVKGFINNTQFILDSTLRRPIPLVSIANTNNNFEQLQSIVNENYDELSEYDYKNRGYDFFNSKPPPAAITAFLVPIMWFDYIEYKRGGIQ